ncbi:hypothetical protein [Psychrobacter sp. M13]|uniref:hypothetical protein n=1 Tax=Psychrobacter sp. M13 TaxID=3067275 RepID=UPI00273B221C|nr:hypothetical protein [Psychrobacter sp. M13]WLP93871.1 hypothetical protein Q9G97_09765 [Psychrobacter sp. M13]
MKDDFKKNNDNKSSADGVTEYLQALENNDQEREHLYYSQEQAFDSDELATIINEARLTRLLTQSDEFLHSLSGEIADFED